MFLHFNLLSPEFLVIRELEGIILSLSSVQRKEKTNTLATSQYLRQKVSKYTIEIPACLYLTVE